MQDTPGNARTASAKTAPDGDAPARRVRLAPEQRAAMILDAAISFFAEHGFDAQLRELAHRLGISQGLIFRYFDSKQALVERVYERVNVARWSTQWEHDLRDRSRALDRRLVDFYRSYMAAVDGFEWIRVALLSGLTTNDLTRRYIETRVDGLLQIVADELHHAMPATRHMDAGVLHELVWHLHSTFIYYLIRKYVFRVPTHADIPALTEAAVGNFLAGLAAAPVSARPVDSHDNKSDRGRTRSGKSPAR